MQRSPPIVSARRLDIPVGGGTDANRVMIENPFVSLRWMLDGLTVDGIETRGASGNTEPRRGAPHLHGRKRLVCT